MLLADLGPLAQLRAGRLGRRLPQLYVGLWLYGVSLAMMVRADLGAAPWDVLHLGIARYVPLSLGEVLIVVSLLVLLLWIPLREVPGLGTISNALVIGVATDATLSVLERPDEMWLRITLMLVGVLGNGAATAFYIGAQLGRGPRDGLMTGLHRRTGVSVTVVAIGLVLGGVAGIGTVLYALSIGPVTQALLPALTVRLRPPAAPPLDEPLDEPGVAPASATASSR